MRRRSRSVPVMFGLGSLGWFRAYRPKISHVVSLPSCSHPRITSETAVKWLRLSPLKIRGLRIQRKRLAVLPRSGLIGRKEPMAVIVKKVSLTRKRTFVQAAVNGSFRHIAALRS